MNTLYTVIDEVYDHTVGVTLAYIRSTFVQDPVQVRSQFGETNVGQRHEIEVIYEDEMSTTKELALPTFRTVSTVLSERPDVTTDRTQTVAYIGSARAPLFATPTKDFDTVITTLSYGGMVMVLEEKGRFSKISQDGLVGWVLRDDLSDRAAYVYPDFEVGGANRVGDPNTERLRAAIGDIFHGNESEVPLQAGEYVTYKLFRKGIVIQWPPTRPRIPGRWHTILRGAPGIHVTVTPKGGSIMEYTTEHDVGHLAYVEAVFPDERITISEANNPDDGIYNERTLAKEEWQQMNPIFMQVS